SDRSRNAAKVSTKQRDVRRLDCDVAACVYRDTDVSFGKSGRIVDSIAHHRDHLSFGTQPLDLVCLSPRHHLGDDTIDSHLARNRFSGSSVVTGYHHYIEAQSLEREYRLLRFGLHSICNRDDTGDATIDRRQHWGFSLRGQQLQSG